MIDFRALKKFGTSNDRLREICTATDTDSPDYEVHQRLKTKIRSDLHEGIVNGLKNYEFYASADLAWDSTILTKEMIPLVRFAQKKLDVKTAAKQLDKLGCLDTFAERNDKGDVIDINLPKFIEVNANLVRSYLSRRIAAQNVRFTELFPFFRYEPRATDLVGKLRADALTQRMETLVDQYGIRHLQGQIITDVFLYGHTVAFPSCSWDLETQYFVRERDEAFASDDPDDVEIKEKVVKEGVDFVLPHPTRVFYDNAKPLAAINWDSGPEFIGYWDIRRYKDVRKNPDYWNRNSIEYSDRGATLFNEFANYFDTYFDCSTIDFPSPRSTTFMGMDNDREANVGVYSEEFDDKAVLVAEYFLKIIPADWGIGDYPSPVWVRFVVSGDDTIIFAEIMPGTPAVYFGYNERDSRQVNISPAHELMPFQDAINNILNQMLISARNDAMKIVMLDTDAVPQEVVEYFEQSFKDGHYYKTPQLITYNGAHARQLGQNAAAPYSEQSSQTKIDANMFMNSVSNLLSIVERLMVLSPQELGQAAPREITATESAEMNASTSTVYSNISASIDEGRGAMKRLLYEYFVTQAQGDLHVPVLDRYPKKALEAAGFRDETVDIESEVDEEELSEFEAVAMRDQNGNLLANTGRKPQQVLTGSPKRLIHDYLFTSRDGPTRPTNMMAAQNLSNIFIQMIQIPGFIEALGDEKFFDVANEIFRLSGAYDIHLEPGGEGQSTIGGGVNEETIAQISDAISQVAEQTGANSEAIMQIRDVIQQMARQAPGPVEEPPVGAPPPEAVDSRAPMM